MSEIDRMKKLRKLTRRKFIQVTASLAAAGPVISCTQATSPWRFLTAEEARTLEAICGQIVPNDQDPGAKEAGVVNFIDRQLCGFHKRHQKAYREGLAGLDQTCLALHGTRFVNLAAEKQLSVLAALEKGEAPGEIWKRR